MKVSIYKDSRTIDTVKVEFDEVVKAIRENNNQEFFFSPSGVMSISGNRKNTLIYSRLIMLRFGSDSLEELESTFQSVIELSTTYCCFRNRERSGLIVLVNTDCIDGHHIIAYRQVFEAYQSIVSNGTLDFQSDEKITCQLSFDPAIYFNPNSVVFEIDLRLSKQNAFSIMDGIYREEFNRQVVFTSQLYSFSQQDWDKFIFTLALNCGNEGIPITKTLEFILSDYGLNMPMKGIVNRAYKMLKERDSLRMVFSVFLKNLRNYKPEVPLDKRVLFEFFILTYIQFKGELNFSEEQFRHHLGIYFSRKKIINEFINLKFLIKGKVNIQVGNKKVPKNTFTINPQKVPELAEIYMEDSKKFLDAVMPVLINIQSGQQTNYYTSYWDEFD
ncbi:hypothetical protein D1614_22845 [Maribellus luteus]|uniref:BT4734-like N-terminal domain-containing protein n=1 Tax=Maribellus luteus TaxID=2305463 RepID=A0A399SRJ1_9BACT|nr:BT4734/BF3469 family protein [Maribellus luteus]RIJ45509.1 hypothetical protein D1614_22845 [Maribellus luteus]